ncbi:DNA binding protein Ncp1 [Mycena indigotica]|uniref:DNA binding protein Ncp1 n=1 Tax=Mycena indigotica TaxID=2126181 RepID=A0A8H6T7E9_9AGAR|nr:DNA binding protein Ncp1 [Mycena indigotica]KAF7312443.1 DNA binding protein Ncp1 [Mycena indigotica]
MPSTTTPSGASEFSVYFDAPIAHMSTKDTTPDAALVESPTSETLATTNSYTNTSPNNPVPENDEEMAEAGDTVAAPSETSNPSPTPSSHSPKTQHARVVSVGRATSIAQRSVFTNADGRSVAGSTFINGAGTTGPNATAEPDDSLHLRAASADVALTDEQKANIAKRESKSNKQIAKIIKSEAKVEKKALDIAVRELSELHNLQKAAVKREEKAQSTYNKTLATFQKHEAVFLAARAKFEASQALLNSHTETLEITRNNAKEATANVQEKSQEVDSLRKMFDVDEREREVKLVELTGKGSTRKRWTLMS